MPMTMSTLPSATSARSARCSAAVRNRLRGSDPDRVVGQTLLEGVTVLLRKDGGGREHRHLLPVLDRLEGRSDRDLGLAVPDVAAHESIHGLVGLHVPLHVLGGLALIGRVFVEERGLHLHLPTRVGGERVAGRVFAARVQLQELTGHLLDGLLGLLAQGLPSLAPDPVEGLRARVLGRAHPPLDQVEAVHGEAQHLTSRVLDREDLDPVAADLDVLQTHEPADAVVHVHDVVTRGQLRQALERDRPAEAAAPAHAPRPPEDLVIVEDAEGGGRAPDLEPGLQRADGEPGSFGNPAHPPEDLLQPLELAVVVAEQERFGPRPGPFVQIGLELADVPVDRRGRGRLQHVVAHRVLAQGQPGQGVDQADHLGGRNEERFRGQRGGPGVHQIVVEADDPGPRPLGLFGHRPVTRAGQDRVCRKQLEEGAGHRGVGIVGPPEVHGEDVRLAEVSGRALVEDVEGPDRGDLVPPELDPDRLARRDREEVEDATPHGELADLLHERDAFEAPALQALDELGERHRVAGLQRSPHAGEVGRDGDAFLQPARRRHQNPGSPGEHRFDRLDPEPPDLEMGLVLLVRQRLLLRKELGRATGAEEHLEVGFGRGRGLGVLRDEDQNPLRVGPVQGRDGDRPERPDDSAERDGAPGPRKCCGEAADGRAFRDCGQDGVRKRHG